MHVFQPVRTTDGYLPIEDHGLIGDLSTAALVGRDGGVTWLCVPRFDAPPLFCGLLDKKRGGGFWITPHDLRESRQFYLDDSGVLVTELRAAAGTLRLTDALTLRSGADLSEGYAVARDELLRVGRVTHGTVALRMELMPRDDVTVLRESNGWRLQLKDRPELELYLVSSLPLDGLQTTVTLQEGDEFHLALHWGRTTHRYQPTDQNEVLQQTVSAWQRWLTSFEYGGPQAPLVRRSALTLKMLDYAASGAIMAAPTSSLPETIGGVRNWDYRYTWIRDAAFSVYALRRIGIATEAWAFLAWVLDAVERHGKPKILYNIDGEDPPPEFEDPHLEGYRRSSPVRWGNGAASQTQHDVYGEILDCAFQWASPGGEMNARLWERLRSLVEQAREKWRTPDHGIWEVRTPGRLFTYSVALCQVALERGARIAEQFGLPGDIAGWRHEAGTITQAILDEAWDPTINSLTEQLGGGGLDASLLALPLRRVIPADHPKMIATTKAVVDRLGAGNGLVYRYLPDESPDGLPGHEGAFLLCSFWLVDNLAKQGRVDEAMELYESLCNRANPLGLLPEQIDPGTGAFLGNFPQAFSHIGVISSGINLARVIKGDRE
jgi:GH15 family glucan-1,4-alpha-glucosidase